MSLSRIGILVFDNMTQLDAMGPFEVLARVPGASVKLVGETLEPVRSDTGLRVLPDVTWDDVGELDLLCIPGGPGVDTQMGNGRLIAWLRAISPSLKYQMSVCTGALIWGAAGQIEGLNVATHWAARGNLEAFGASASLRRVERDGKLLSGGGVTAGIDLALWAVGELVDPTLGQAIQLGLHYAPEPPWKSGSPEEAPASLVKMVRAAMGRRSEERGAAVRAAIENGRRSNP